LACLLGKTGHVIGYGGLAPEYRLPDPEPAREKPLCFPSEQRRIGDANTAPAQASTIKDEWI